MVVPTLRAGEGLSRLFESLDAQTATPEVLVVDNGSGGDAARRAAAHEGVEVIEPGHNTGFSRAVNLAAASASGDVLVLVNDDCRCEPGFVAALVAAVDPAAGVTMAAGVLRDRHDPSRIDTAGMELDPTLLVFDYLNGEPMDTVATAPDPVGPCGAAAAFDRREFLAAGGFDERLFAYWEDVDLVLRLRQRGGRCALARGAVGVHDHSTTLGSGSARKNWLTGFGRGFVLRKWGVLTPGRLPGVAARDGVICLGQAVVDRNLGGVRGRVSGFRAARERRPYPEDAPARNRRTSVAGTLRRRARRRTRLRLRPRSS